MLSTRRLAFAFGCALIVSACGQDDSGKPQASGTAGSSGGGAGAANVGSNEAGGSAPALDASPPAAAEAGSGIVLDGSSDAGAIDEWSQSWPQAGGPDGTWRVAGTGPKSWSVTLNQNIVWRTALPSGGQGGIAVWGDHVFLTTFESYVPGAPKTSATILGHALDATTGKILWSVKLVGETPSPMMYAYSDSTSWSPITDGKYVWFFNSSGEMGCWDWSGKEIWRRQFHAPDEPFNKQHEPFMAGDTIVSAEPLSPDEAGYRADRALWNYLRGIDKMTGKTKWIADDALTHYTTAVSGILPNGSRAVLFARGGPHDVPERPVGVTFASLETSNAGQHLWRYAADQPAGTPSIEDGVTLEALYTMTWDQKYGYWFRNAPEESHLVFDINTGALLRTQSLIKNVDVRQWDLGSKKYVVRQNVSIRDVQDSPAYPLAQGEVLHVHPNWAGNLAVNGYHYFSTMTNNRRNSHAPPGHSGPAHALGRINVETGKVEYLEVPVGVTRAMGQPDAPIYGRSLRTKALDSKGQDLANEDRSNTDGWEIPAFFGTPTVVGDTLYMGTMLGVTYIVDTKAAVFDEHALLAVGDLGPLGETWSLNSISYSRGRLYHRSSKEVVCIGPAP